MARSPREQPQGSDAPEEDQVYLAAAAARLSAVYQVMAVVGVSITAVRVFKLSVRENGLLWQEITLSTLVGNHRMRELGIAVIALENPLRHTTYRTRSHRYFYTWNNVLSLTARSRIYCFKRSSPRR